MTDFKVCHQSLEERVPDLSVLAILSLCDCFESLIKLITLFLSCLNLTQCPLKLVRLAFFTLSYKPAYLHAGSSELKRVFLLGMHSFAIIII